MFIHFAIISDLDLLNVCNVKSTSGVLIVQGGNPGTEQGLMFWCFIVVFLSAVYRGMPMGSMALVLNVSVFAGWSIAVYTDNFSNRLPQHKDWRLVKS